MVLSEVFVSDFGADSMCYGKRDGFYADFGVMTFEIEVLLCVWGFAVNICDNLVILIFNEDVSKQWFFEIMFNGEL